MGAVVSTLTNVVDHGLEGFAQAHASQDAKKALVSLIVKFRQDEKTRAKLTSPRSKLPQALPEIIKLLASVSDEVHLVLENDLNTNKNTALLHLNVAVPVLCRMLHVPGASHYRALGLSSNATFKQIENHRMWLNSMLRLEVDEDRQRSSLLRIEEAYKILHNPELRHHYDLMLHGYRETSKRSSFFGRTALVTTLLGVTISGAIYYFSRNPNSATIQASAHLSTNQGVLGAATGNSRELVQLTSELDSGDLADAVEGQTEPLLTITVSPLSLVVESSEQLNDDDLLVDAIESTQILSTTAENELNVSNKEQPVLDTPETFVKPDTPRLDVALNEDELSKQSVVDTEVEKNEKAQMLPASPDILVDTSNELRDVSVAASAVSINEAKRLAQQFRAQQLALKSENGFQADSAELITEGEINRNNTPGLSLKSNPSSKRASITEERQQPIEQEQVGRMVVVGSPSLSIDTLTKEQVRKIVLGEVDALPNGEAVVFIDQQDGSDLKELFCQEIVGKSCIQVKAHWAKLRITGKKQSPEILLDDKAVKDKIANSSSAIGFVNSAVVDDTVKVLITEP